MRSRKTTIAIIAAFAAVYVIWGSTYLVIRFAIETLPPFFMASIRFGTAGIVLLAFLMIRGVALPTLPQIRNCALTGAMLLLAGNGGVSWVEQYVPSGIVALVNATIPCWMVLFSVLAGEKRPSGRELLALVIGAAGVVLLMQSGGDLAFASGAPSWVFIVLVVGTCSWALGSVFARRANMPTSPFMATAFQMLFGGLFLCIVGLLNGEATSFQPELISVRSVLALSYLTVFGSIVAFSAYVWLLRIVPASRVASYAYVNPLIAMLLGWLFGNEELSGNSALAAALVVAAVFLITVTPDIIGKARQRVVQLVGLLHRNKVL